MEVNLRLTLSLFLGLIAWGSPVVAQSAVGGPVASILLSRPTSGPLRALGLVEPADRIERDIRPTHWKEGALVGGLVGLAGGAVLGSAFCRNSEELGKSCTGSAVVGGLIVGLVLAIPGALIGGQIPKGGTAE